MSITCDHITDDNPVVGHMDPLNIGLCADCANRREREAFAAAPKGSRFTGYVTGADPHHLTTWLGAPLAPVTYIERRATFHPSIGRCVRESVHVQFLASPTFDPLTPRPHIVKWYGFRFAGHPGAGDVITMRRTA